MNFKKALAAAAILAVSASATAIPLSGTLQMNTFGDSVDTDGNGNGDAFDFGGGGGLDTDVTAGSLSLVPTTGAFLELGINNTDTFSFKDIATTASTAAAQSTHLPNANNPFFQVTITNAASNYTGAILSFDATDATTNELALGLEILVTGILSLDVTGVAGGCAGCLSYTDTAVTLLFQSIDGSSVQGTLDAAGIPEPATLALIGLGLAGIGAARRKQA